MALDVVPEPLAYKMVLLPVPEIPKASPQRSVTVKSAQSVGVLA